jgi:hypothetical protein
MKVYSLIIIAVGLTLALNSCSETCYYCSKDSYWNGISYTEPGPYANNCRDEGETDEAYESRINEKRSKGYTCKKK